MASEEEWEESKRRNALLFSFDFAVRQTLALRFKNYCREDEKLRRECLERAQGYAQMACLANRLLLDEHHQDKEGMYLNSEHQHFKRLAKLLGLLFFYADEECPEFEEKKVALGNGCCSVHRMEGWKEALKAFEPLNREDVFVMCRHMRACIVLYGDVSKTAWREVVRQNIMNMKEQRDVNPFFFLVLFLS